VLELRQSLRRAAPRAGIRLRGCEDCLDEAMELLAREAAGKELYPAERQILAAARRRPCVHCKTKNARWDSIYCSDICKQAFLRSLRQEVA